MTLKKTKHPELPRDHHDQLPVQNHGQGLSHGLNHQLPVHPHDQDLVLRANHRVDLLLDQSQDLLQGQGLVRSQVQGLALVQGVDQIVSRYIKLRQILLFSSKLTYLNIRVMSLSVNLIFFPFNKSVKSAFADSRPLIKMKESVYIIAVLPITDQGSP